MKTKIYRYRAIILPIVSCRCKAWSWVSHTEEEHRLRLEDNRLLRKLFGYMRGAVKGEWGKLHK